MAGVRPYGEEAPFLLPVECFKLAIQAGLTGNRVTCIEPLFLDSSHLGIGESGERPATERFGDAERRDNRLDVGIQELPVGLKAVSEPRSHSLYKQVGSSSSPHDRGPHA